MARLCELPSCSRTAEVAYGFDAPARLIWFDAYDEATAHTVAGRLCRRHAVSLIPPRGWNLEDRRVEEGLLFLPPEKAQTPTPTEVPPRPELPARAARPADPLPTLPFDLPPDEPQEVVAVPEADQEPEPVSAWTPHFDADDDAGGLLRATTPLLSRAFTAGTRRKEQSE